MIKLIEKIEGEATLDFKYKKNAIDFVNIKFANTRGMERILEGRPALDALVINPRVCGICGHAHLIATVKALEDCYDDLKISNKAKIVRELTMNFELIQNHFKWFYLTLMPLFGYKQHVLKAAHPSAIMAKAIATLAGQYPHNSYAIPGGITSEILPLDIVNVEHYINQTMSFFKDNLLDVDIERLLVCKSIDTVFSKKGDLAEILKKILNENMQYLGKSHDQFIVFGENSYFKSGKSRKTRAQNNVKIKYVEEFENSDSYAKNVMYRDKYYEVGPLSRAMVKKTPLIKDSHRRYADSIFSRILARSCEIPQLLRHSLDLLKMLDLSEPSYIKPKTAIEEMTSSGESAVEAARGSLIHKVNIQKGIIQKYDIITPTQWNLGNGTKEQPGVSQKAMIGLKDTDTAEMVFKTFDVCSVCTTQ